MPVFRNPGPPTLMRENPLIRLESLLIITYVDIHYDFLETANDRDHWILEKTIGYIGERIAEQSEIIERASK